MNQASVTQHAALIPGALETVAGLRARGLKIGSTTGYNRPIMNVVAPLVAAQGYQPDKLVCAGDMASARPGPLMMVRTLSDLGVWPPAAVVKVDDTVPGLHEGREGRAVGTWVVGLAITGNCLGLSEAEWLATKPAQQALLRAQARQTLLDGGAHFVIDGVADLLPLIDEIEVRMAASESPA